MNERSGSVGARLKEGEPIIRLRNGSLLRAMLVALAAAALAPSGAYAENVINIGVPLSMSGKGADYGGLSATAAKMAEEEINKSGGVRGTKVKVVIADTGGDNQQAVNLTRRFASQENAIAAVGYIFSGEVEQAFPVANALKFVVVSNSSSKPGIMERLRPWGFRNTGTEEKLQEATIAAWKQRYGIKRVAIVADLRDAYAKDLGLKVFPTLLKSSNIEIVNADSPITYNLGDVDFTAQVTRLKSMSFDGVAIGGQYTEGALFIKEMRRQGIKAPVISGVGFLAREFLEIGRGDVNGTMVGTTFWSEKPDPKLQAFVKEFGGRMKGDKPDYRAAAMYDTLFMMRDIMVKKGITGDPSKLQAEREALRQGLDEMSSYQGIMGETKFDKLGDGIKEVYTLEARDGQFVRYTK